MKHLAAYLEIHASNPSYGPGPCPTILKAMAHELRSVTPKAALDWGCGNSKALETLFPKAKRHLYDPAIPGHDTIPRGRYDIGICTDVMEHIPEDEIDDTLQKQSLVCHDWLYIIDNKVAIQLLPDGSNAHVIQKPAAWWKHRMGCHFDRVWTWPCDATRFFVRARLSR